MKNRALPLTALVAIIALVVWLVGPRFAANADAMSGTSKMMSHNPSVGFNLHIDAEKHFGTAHPKEIAHHWCKKINDDLTECQIYDADGPTARLVAVETIVSPTLYKTFSPAEQKLWHWHKVEVPKVNATLPDTPKDQQAKIVASILPTYGKIWLLWDPMSNNQPTGQPSITVLK